MNFEQKLEQARALLVNKTVRITDERTDPGYAPKEGLCVGIKPGRGDGHVYVRLADGHECGMGLYQVEENGCWGLTWTPTNFKRTVQLVA